MEKFLFKVDQLQSIWNRTYVTVEANSKEEAEKKLLDATDGYEIEEIEGVSFNDSEYLYDTAIQLCPCENENNSTFEILDEEENLIYSNSN